MGAFGGPKRPSRGSSSIYPSPTGSSSKFFSSSSKSSLDYGQLVSSNNSAAVAWELLVQGVYRVIVLSLLDHHPIPRQ
jgi:hypothetical protein